MVYVRVSVACLFIKYRIYKKIHFTMKRKGIKKAQKQEDESNGIEVSEEKNGESSNTEEKNPLEIEEPKEKKRKSKTPKKNVSFSSKKNHEDSNDDEDEEMEEQPKVKDKKKKSVADEDEEDDDNDDETQYEVEKIIDDKNIKGVHHYLIRWKGYEEESDTWEPEDTLSCPDLIETYKNFTKKSKTKKGTTKNEKKSDTWDENEDFEVERILEVHHKRDGKREFLVSWKGYSNKDNSWEPEENMNCKDLIEKFMAKVENARNADEHELRVNRKHVQRLTYNTPDSNRRLSRRNQGKERVQYHDAE